MRNVPTTIALAASATLILAACGSSDDDTDPATTQPPTATDTDTETDTPTDTATHTETVTETNTQTEEPSPTDEPTDDETDTTPAELPGEAVEIFPYAGDELLVVAVPADGSLGLYGLPGGAEEITRLDPWEVTPIATGHNRSVDNEGFWVEIEADGQVGWASRQYLAYEGAINDITSELEELPAAASMTELAQEVASGVASTDGPVSTVTIVAEPTEGDLAEVIVDVTGLGDDSLYGFRMHIFAVQEGGQYQTRTVESTVLCLRGVNDGVCL